MPKLVKPKKYPKIIHTLKRYITANTEKDVKSLGFIKLDSCNKYGHSVKKYRYDATWDVGSPCSINIATDNGKVAVMELEIPLFFRQYCVNVPDYKLMEHLDCFFMACFKKLGLEECVGPILDNKENPIEWSTDVNLEEIAAKHSLKYEDIPMVKNGFAGILYPCRDAKGNLWLIDLSCDYLSVRMQDTLSLFDVFLKLHLSKMAKRKGEPVKVILYQ